MEQIRMKRVISNVCSVAWRLSACAVVWCGVRWCVGLWHVVFIVIATSRERSVCCVVLTDDSHKQREECVLWCGVLFLVCCVA